MTDTEILSRMEKVFLKKGRNGQKVRLFSDQAESNLKYLEELGLTESEELFVVGFFNSKKDYLFVTTRAIGYRSEEKDLFIPLKFISSAKVDYSRLQLSKTRPDLNQKLRIDLNNGNWISLDVGEPGPPFCGVWNVINIGIFLSKKTEQQNDSVGEGS